MSRDVKIKAELFYQTPNPTYFTLCHIILISVKLFIDLSGWFHLGQKLRLLAITE